MNLFCFYGYYYSMLDKLLYKSNQVTYSFTLVYKLLSYLFHYSNKIVILLLYLTQRKVANYNTHIKKKKDSKNKTFIIFLLL